MSLGGGPQPHPGAPTFPPLPFSKAQGSTRRAGATAMAPARARQFRPRRGGQAPDAALGGTVAGADLASQAQPRLQHGRVDPARYDPARGAAAWPRRRAAPRRARPQHARGWPRRRRGVHLRPGATASFGHELAPVCAHVPGQRRWQPGSTASSTELASSPTSTELLSSPAMEVVVPAPPSPPLGARPPSGRGLHHLLILAPLAHAIFSQFPLQQPMLFLSLLPLRPSGSLLGGHKPSDAPRSA